MKVPYNHKEIEAKWQQAWDKAKLFEVPSRIGKNHEKPKKYILDMFPYPSGSGLHVGHLEGYTGSDVLARLARKQGFEVLHPMGWDAFGLPAENYAIKKGKHPADTTSKNIAEFKRQMKKAGLSYDWTREINSSEPDYYKWTQWFFSLLYKRGLAYRKKGLVNWCPGCQTVLANEQVVNGACERCGSSVMQKELEQWYFKITDYADRLLEGLDTIDWPEKIKTMQRNWIGRSEGARLIFDIDGSPDRLEVFTTRPETVFGATFIVLAPEHPLVSSITTSVQKNEVEKYRKDTSRKSELERTFLEKEKSGVFTGAFAFNPATKDRIPIWIADYVLSSYGTGAIMAVPAHDERDFAFATKYNLPIIPVVETNGAPLPFLGKTAIAIEGKYKGKQVDEILDDLLQEIGGEKKVTFRLRDWLVSRQRLWGSPIPIVYDKDGKEHLLHESALPVELPQNVEFLPNGQSPLLHATEWKKYIDPETGEEMTREVDTLDTFVCSSWYYLRYVSPQNKDAAFDKTLANYWLPVDHYIGGAEHAVLHLLYARFFTKVLFDAGYVSFDEPFRRLSSVGIILGPDHNKMSKSKGNVINPDDVIEEYGADSLRLYELFMGPFDQEKPWNTKGLVGVRRFLEKVWRLSEKISEKKPSQEELVVLHKLIKKVGDDTPELKFNTSIAAMMEAVNAWSEQAAIAKDTYLTFLSVLNPYAPHITEELWEQQKGDGFCSLAQWPTFHSEYIQEDTVEYVIQVNGKVRARITLPAGSSETVVMEAVLADAKIKQNLQGKKVRKHIFVPDRLVSLVV